MADERKRRRGENEVAVVARALRTANLGKISTQDAPLFAVRVIRALDAHRAAAFADESSEIAEEIAANIQIGLGVMRVDPGKNFWATIVNVVVTALRAAERRGRAAATAFVPTHRHYKGSLYQVLYRDVLHTEFSRPMVVYRNETGRIFTRPQIMFDGVVAEELRFAPLLPKGEA